MSACYCTGKCHELGYCPNTIGPWRPQSTIAPPAPIGWTCPVCGVGVAPWRSSCPRCDPPVMVNLTITSGE